MRIFVVICYIKELGMENLMRGHTCREPPSEVMT
jgi:hypothetical protein